MTLKKNNEATPSFNEDMNINFQNYINQLWKRNEHKKLFKHSKF